MDNGGCSQVCVNDLPDPSGVAPGYHCECRAQDTLHPNNRTCIHNSICSFDNEDISCSCRPGYQDPTGAGLNCTG